MDFYNLFVSTNQHGRRSYFEDKKEDSSDDEVKTEMILTKVEEDGKIVWKTQNNANYDGKFISLEEQRCQRCKYKYKICEHFPNRDVCFHCDKIGDVYFNECVYCYISYDKHKYIIRPNLGSYIMFECGYNDCINGKEQFIIKNNENYENTKREKLYNVYCRGYRHAELEKENEILKEQLKYMPGGEGYFEVKSHFEENIKKD